MSSVTNPPLDLSQFKLSDLQNAAQKRIEDIKERYKPGSNYAKTNPSLVKAMQKGLERVFEVCETVQRLRQGKLKEEEIRQYGFI